MVTVPGKGLNILNERTLKTCLITYFTVLSCRSLFSGYFAPKLENFVDVRHLGYRQLCIHDVTTRVTQVFIFGTTSHCQLKASYYADSPFLID